MSKDCSIVQDLLPLYAEDMLREETKKFINGHLSQCAACRAELDALRADVKPQPVSAQPLRELKKRLRRKKLTAVLLAVTLALTLATTGFAYLTAPQYLPYNAADWSVHEPDASLDAVLNGEEHICIEPLTPVSGTEVESVIDPDSGETVYIISAWRTLLDKWLGKLDTVNGNGDKLILLDTTNCRVVYYAQNNGQENMVLYGERSGGVISLPRLALGYYAVLSLMLFIAFCIAFLICRKKKAAKPLGYLALAPASYLAGHLLVKGLTTTSYQMQRDFSLIVFAAVLIYSAVLLTLSLLQQKREDHDHP
mgnify:CR=1 FL=1